MPKLKLVNQTREGSAMARFKLPLSGDVVQWINPITWFASGNQVNVYLGHSSAPEVEAEILDRVGTYGRQLGQLCDAVVVLLRHADEEQMSAREREVLRDFQAMADQIADVKERFRRPAVRP